MDFDTTAVLAHERLFRGGAKSGQRRIAAFVGELAASGAYRLLATVSDARGYPIHVMLRNDPS